MKNSLKIFLILVTLCFESCMKQPNFNENETPPVDPKTIQKTILNAWGDFSFSNIKKNEFVAVDTTQKIETRPPEVVFQEGITVSNRVVAADTIDFTLLHQTVEYSGGQAKLSTTEEKVSIPKPKANLAIETQSELFTAPIDPYSTQSVATEMTTENADPSSIKEKQIRPMTIGALVAFNFMNACVNKPNWDVHCQNLKIEDEVRDAPPDIKKAPNCMGLVDCKIKVKKISFSLSINIPDTATNTIKKEKVIYRLAISQDVPYLSKLMEYCYRGLMTLKGNGQKILVEVCNNVTSFRPGLDLP